MFSRIEISKGRHFVTHLHIPTVSNTKNNVTQKEKRYFRKTKIKKMQKNLKTHIDMKIKQKKSKE